MALTLTTIPEVADDSHSGEPTYRHLPQNLEAEKALLGAIFVNNQAYDRISDFLKAEHFALPQHGRIFQASGVLIERGQIADPVTLRNFFQQDESLADIGGPAYLAELAASAVTIINTIEYGRIIYDLFLRRQLITLGEDVVNGAYDAEVEVTAANQIEAAEQRLYNLADTGRLEGGFQSFKSSVLTAIKAAEMAHQREGGLSGVTSGLIDIDKLLGGLHPSDLIVLAGRPGMGKTALATNIAFNAAYSKVHSDKKDGAVVGFFSLEMSAEQLASRVISEQSNISSDQMRKGLLSAEEFDRLVVASQELHSIPIFIDDTPALSVSALRTRARRLKRTHDLGLIVVDYLQLMSGSATSRNEGRVQEISEITRGLKTLAKDLNVPVLALSQLSRAVEQREDKRPQLSDLRESGTIEQDADVVMFIFREEYYLEREKPIIHPSEKEDRYAEKVERWESRREEVRNLAEVIVAKQRHGPTGTVNLRFEGQFTRFHDLDQQHSSPTF
jgi:replicative DNA helicase